MRAVAVALLAALLCVQSVEGLYDLKAPKHRAKLLSASREAHKAHTSTQVIKELFDFKQLEEDEGDTPIDSSHGEYSDPVPHDDMLFAAGDMVTDSVQNSNADESDADIVLSSEEGDGLYDGEDADDLFRSNTLTPDPDDGDNRRYTSIAPFVNDPELLPNYTFREDPATEASPVIEEAPGPQVHFATTDEIVPAPEQEPSPRQTRNRMGLRILIPSDLSNKIYDPDTGDFRQRLATEYSENDPYAIDDMTSLDDTLIEQILSTPIAPVNDPVPSAPKYGSEISSEVSDDSDDELVLPNTPMPSLTELGRGLSVWADAETVASGDNQSQFDGREPEDTELPPDQPEDQDQPRSNYSDAVPDLVPQSEPLDEAEIAERREDDMNLRLKLWASGKYDKDQTQDQDEVDDVLLRVEPEIADAKEEIQALQERQEREYLIANDPALIMRDPHHEDHFFHTDPVHQVRQEREEREDLIANDLTIPALVIHDPHREDHFFHTDPPRRLVHHPRHTTPDVDPHHSSPRLHTSPIVPAVPVYNPFIGGLSNIPGSFGGSSPFGGSFAPYSPMAVPGQVPTYTNPFTAAMSSFGSYPGSLAPGYGYGYGGSSLMSPFGVPMMMNPMLLWGLMMWLASIQMGVPMAGSLAGSFNPTSL